MSSNPAEPFYAGMIEPPRPIEAKTRGVLHLINGEHYSGAERVQDLLALGLPQFGFRAGFACLKLDRFERCRTSHEQAELFNVPMLSRFDLLPARRIARLIERNHYHILHSHTPRAALIGRLAATMAGVPLVHHFHSPTAVDSGQRLRNRFNVAIERSSLMRVAGVIAVSRSLADYARRQGIDRRRIFVVPNGVPTLGSLAPRPTPRGSWTIGTVALFRPRKGLEVLLAALAELVRQGQQVRLRAVGGFETPEYEAHIHREAARLGVADRIEWTGFTRNVAAEMAKLDLFVLPSLFGEGLPMVVLEAMAAGVPVVATRVEGIPEALRDELDGLLAAPGNSNELAHAIGRVTAGEVGWQALRISAHERQAKKFSDVAMSRGVALVYRRVMHR